jgi:hypothetical protein
MRSEVFTAVKIQIEVFLVVMLCSFASTAMLQCHNPEDLNLNLSECVETLQLEEERLDTYAPQVYKSHQFPSFLFKKKV